MKIKKLKRNVRTYKCTDDTYNAANNRLFNTGITLAEMVETLLKYLPTMEIATIKKLNNHFKDK